MAESSTPKKFFRFIKFTPTTKKTLCVICGNRIEKSDYRRKLFHGSIKSEYCILIEKYLEINITEETHADTACRKCVRELQKIDSVFTTFKSSYQNTLAKLRETHGHNSVSFKRQFSEDGSATVNSRKSLFPRDEGKEEDPEFNIDTETDTELKVIICRGLKNEIRCMSAKHFPILDALTSGDMPTVGLLISKIPDLQDVFQETVFDTIKGEIKTLALRENNSILRKHDKIKSLTFARVIDEWRQKAPTFLKSLEAAVANPAHQFNKYKKGEALIPGIVTAGCKLLTLYSKDLNAFQHFNSYILWKGGCKKSAFSRLNATYDCLSYQSTLSLADKLGNDWDKDLVAMQELVTTETSHELVLLQNIQMIKESIDLVNGDADTMVQRILELSNAENDLHQYRDLMHPGFYFVGDNVDMRTKVRNMTIYNQHKDHHMYQICAYENRISGNHLDNTVAKGDANTVPFTTFIPSQLELDSIASDFTFLVAKIWSQHIPHFNIFAPVLPEYIEHQYMKEMKQKTARINMGVLMKSEQYNEDMTDICEFMHKYVPGHNETDDWTKQPQKVLSGGDYLTFERHKQAQSSKRNGRTPTKRLEGLVPKMEEFHNQGELLKLQFQVIWKLLYSTSSARDQGTLYAARNTINARNVTQDPADDFYAASDLVEKVTTAYIITGGLTHFEMESIDSLPCKNVYEGAVGNTNEMKEYIFEIIEREL
ncbi:uncharacterized protein LOC134687728 [Mytilus trossulus]|uniref:uncharacterized protein LOC134687728 n=1 Tax=Mytilus trossulus TaxID=6551 RepID=UPI0030045729